MCTYNFLYIVLILFPGSKQSASVFFVLPFKPHSFQLFFLKSLGRSHVESFNESTQRDGYGGPVAIDKLPVKSDSIASVKIIK
jgi:hypothetical protein